jgi:hypothetical protein
MKTIIFLLFSVCLVSCGKVDMQAVKDRQEKAQADYERAVFDREIEKVQFETKLKLEYAKAGELK